MKEREITKSADNAEDIEIEDSEDIDDAGSVDAETIVLGGPVKATISNSSVPVNVQNRPLISLQVAETFKALNRPLISLQMADTIRALNRPLISLQMADTIRALNRPLISLQMADTIKALNRPLISLQVAETIRALNRPLISLQMAETIKALNRPLISLQVAETIRALSRPPVKSPYMESTSYLNLAPRVATTQKEQEMRSALVVVDEEEYSLLEERSYWVRVFDTLVKDDGLRKSCRSLFADGYYALAVERAYIYIDNLVSKRSGRSDKDGADLMRTVFSPKNPVLKFNNLQSRSEENQQQGYMHIFEGTMIGIRNPRAHEYDFEDSPEEALEMLVIASHLIRMINRASSV